MQSDSKHSKLSDLKVFLRAWLKSPKRTGANIPSSQGLAKLIVSAANVDQDSKVIELGPGTGVFTKALLDAGVEPENLTLIELNPEFRQLLQKRYPKVEILDADAFQYMSELANNKGDVDYTIVSGLPLLVFPTKIRKQLKIDILKIIGKTGRMAQFTYGLKSPMPLDDSMEAHCSKRVWKNSPPAVVWTYTNPKI